MSIVIINSNSRVPSAKMVQGSTSLHSILMSQKAGL